MGLFSHNVADHGYSMTHAPWCYRIKGAVNRIRSHPVVILTASVSSWRADSEIFQHNIQCTLNNPCLKSVEKAAAITFCGYAGTPRHADAPFQETFRAPFSGAWPVLLSHQVTSLLALGRLAQQLIGWSKSVLRSCTLALKSCSIAVKSADSLTSCHIAEVGVAMTTGYAYFPCGRGR